MSKAERKAALKAAKKAAKGNATETVANTETKKEDKKENPQVAAPAATQEKKAPTPPKAPETKKTDPKKDTQKAPDQQSKKKDKTPTIIPETVDPTKKALDRAANLVNGVTTGIPIGSSGSSVDGKGMLAYVMWEKYGKNEELSKHYPELYQDLMRGVDVVTLLALVDVRQDLISRNERGELTLSLEPDQIMPLQSMADMLGIKLAPAKALPGAVDGQMSIDFAKSEVPEELTKGNKAPEKVELDPNKITNDEMLIAALDYLIKTGKNMAENIVNTVEWYRTYCITKETNADKKLQLDDKSVYEWINEIFSKIQPAGLLQGLGRSVYLYTSQTGSPCMAHSILHTYMSKAGWSEEQIASVLKALVNENFRYKLKDDDKLKPTEDKALNAIVGNLGTEYIDTLFANYNITNDTLKAAGDKAAELEASRKTSRQVLGSVRTNYFDPKHSPTEAELRMAVGQIINLYRDPQDRLAEYCQSTVTPPTEGEFPAKEEAKSESATTGTDTKPADEKKN